MQFIMDSDNRSGHVKADSGTDDRSARYSGGDGREKVSRLVLVSRPSGDGTIEASIDTFSEFVGKSGFECRALTLRSKGVINLPSRPANGGFASVQDRISMGIRITQPGRVRLKASVLSDMNTAFVELRGPEFRAKSLSAPNHGAEDAVVVFEDLDRVFEINTPGEYTLTGAYQMALHLPNSTTGGRDLVIEMSANLTHEP